VKWVVCRHVSEDVPDWRENWVVCRHVSEDVPGLAGDRAVWAGGYEAGGDEAGSVAESSRTCGQPGCPASRSGTLVSMAAQTHRTELDLREPFSRADARRAGIPVKHLTSRRFRRLFYDAYVSADVPVTPVVRASAALRISPFGSHASHHTAAQIWDGVVPDQPLTHVSSPHGGTRSARQGVGSHQSSDGSEVVTFGGLQVSSPAQTFIDLATELTLVDLVVLGDSLVKKGRATPRQLIEATLRWKGKGCRSARRAARLVRVGVDSPMETRLRLLMVFAGLPEPAVNHIVFDARGAVSKRFDLSYPELKLVIEYDGRQHAESDRQWERDTERREEMDVEEWRLIVIRSKDIYVQPLRTLERIVDAMRACGARGLPRTLNREWERHFPGR